MATTDRQNRLLVSEDWRKIYQSFQQADFKSYDFETLRRTMVAYLQENYPDDFNDFVESSEYIALIDLIAYISQALSFRIDLNARENFLETAERRNSVLRLARLINYNASRNKPATGLLKINSISTTEDVAKFLWKHSSNKYLTEKSIKEMTTPQKTKDGKTTNYGLGWRTRYDKNNNVLIGHTGGSVGGTTYAFMAPHSNTIVVMTTNLSSASFGSLANDLFEIFE